MTGVSSIDRMPQEIRDLIKQCFEQGWTVTDVADHLKAMGVDVSRSAVGRKRKEWGEIVSKVAESRTYAEIMIRSFRDAPASEVAQANVEMLQSLLFSYLRNKMQGDKITLKPAEFMLLAKTSNSLGGARKTEVETTMAAMKAATAMETESAQGDGGRDTIEIEFVDPPPYDREPVQEKAETLGELVDKKKQKKGKSAENAPTDACNDAGAQ